MRGSRSLDGRSLAAQELKKTMASLASARGCSTWNELAPALQILARRAAFKSLICGSLEDEALQNKKEIPETLWTQYLMWSNSLRADLVVFGIERIPKDVSRTLDEVKQALRVESDE